MNAKNIVNLHENTINTLNIQTSEYGTSSTTQKNIIYQIYEPVASFTGRNPEIQNIHENLQTKHKFVVTGLGGLGKTELLRTYAKKFQSSYENLIWINCETKVDLKKSFYGLALELGIEVVKFKTERNLDIIITDIYMKLEGEKTLLIFDNVTSFKEITMYMPRHSFYCLLSSQNTEWGSIASLPLKVLTPEEAKNLMKDNLPEGSYDHVQEIEQLVETLQYLPLALQQAVAYITDKRNYVLNSYKTRDYLKEFSEEESLLNHKFPGGLAFPDYSDQKYDKTIFINIQLMLHKIRSNNEDAENIIFIASYFAPDFIKKDMFYPLINKTNTENAVRVLAKYSSVTIHNDWIFIHRLVQKVIRFIVKNKNFEYEIMMKALTLSAQDILLFQTHLCSILRYVQTKPKVYLNFYHNFILEGKIQFLHFIARHNFFVILKMLLNSDTNYDIKNDDLCFHVVFSDNVEMMIFVHMKGADVNKKDVFYTSPLHVAVLRNSFQMVDCLVRLGADLNSTNLVNFTPIYFGLLMNYTNIVEYVIRKGYNLNIKISFLNEIWEELPLEMRTDSLKEQLSVEWTPLIFAAAFSNMKTVKLLVDLGADVNYRTDPFTTASIMAIDRDDPEIFKYLWVLQDKNDIFPDTSLHKACKYGHVEIVQFLLDNNVDVNGKNFNDNTPLMKALQTQDIEIVKLLIEKGADVTISNLKGEFPLMVAVSSKNIDLIQYLLTTDCDLNQQRNDGLTSLDVAILEGSEKITKFLLENGATINRRNRDALFYSILKGNLVILKHLVEYKVDLMKKYSRSNNEDYSVLHLCSEFGHLDIFQYLCKFLSFNKTTLGNSVLHVACCFGHLDIVKEILTITSEDYIDDLNNKNETPSHLAVINGYFDITALLIDKGADVNIKNKSGDTPFLLAAKHNHLNILLLLENEALPSTTNNNEDTALHLSVAGNNSEIVKHLLDHNFKINVFNKDGQSPVHLASFYGYIEILQILCQKDANINAQNYYGNTPMHLGVMGGHLSVVKFLIEKGARLDVKNKNDFLPIHLAKKRKLNAIADLINSSSCKRFYWNTRLIGIALLIVLCYIKYKT